MVRVDAVRRRVVARTGSDGVPPPELLVGTCVEIWTESGAPTPAFSAWRRHRSARREWAAGRGLSVAETCKAVPAGPPWSVEFLLAQGRRDDVVARLAQAGVTLDDLPALRAAADGR